MATTTRTQDQGDQGRPNESTVALDSLQGSAALGDMETIMYVNKNKKISIFFAWWDVNMDQTVWKGLN